MNKEYRKEYSSYLMRDMEYLIYGHDGKPCIVFPCQDGHPQDYEDFGMVEVLRPYIDQGRLRLICVDSVDKESWSANWRNPRERIETQEAYFNYIVNELVPSVKHQMGRDDLMVTGNSMGGAHTTNTFFRRPDLFDSMISLSGSLDAGYFFGNYMDDLVYNNSPVHFLKNMPYDHHYWDMYRNRKIFICIGQGAWEGELLPGNREMARILAQHNVPAMVDFWGHDVNHDWNWWHKQILYFMNMIIGGI